MVAKSRKKNSNNPNSNDLQTDVLLTKRIQQCEVQIAFCLW